MRPDTLTRDSPVLIHDLLRYTHRSPHTQADLLHSTAPRSRRSRPRYPSLLPWRSWRPWRFNPASSERIRHPRENVLPRFVVAAKGVFVGEEDAVAEDDRHVAGDLPVEEEVRLPAEEALAARGRLVDRGVGVELVVEENVGADLHAAERAHVRQREGRAADADGEEVRDLRREREAGVQEAEGVEGVVVG